MGVEGSKTAVVLRLTRYVVAFTLLWRPRGGLGALVDLGRPRTRAWVGCHVRVSRALHKTYLAGVSKGLVLRFLDSPILLSSSFSPLVAIFQAEARRLGKNMLW